MEQAKPDIDDDDYDEWDDEGNLDDDGDDDEDNVPEWPADDEYNDLDYCWQCWKWCYVTAKNDLIFLPVMLI